MPRPPIDLHQKVRDILAHVAPLPAEAATPLAHCDRTSMDLWNLLRYVERVFRQLAAGGRRGHKDVWVGPHGRRGCGDAPALSRERDRRQGRGNLFIQNPERRFFWLVVLANEATLNGALNGARRLQWPRHRALGSGREAAGVGGAFSEGNRCHRSSEG
jgi:hypothetical protein